MMNKKGPLTIVRYQEKDYFIKDETSDFYMIVDSNLNEEKISVSDKNVITNNDLNETLEKFLETFEPTLIQNTFKDQLDLFSTLEKGDKNTRPDNKALISYLRKNIHSLWGIYSSVDKFRGVSPGIRLFDKDDENFTIQLYNRAYDDLDNMTKFKTIKEDLNQRRLCGDTFVFTRDVHLSTIYLSPILKLHQLPEISILYSFIHTASSIWNTKKVEELTRQLEDIQSKESKAPIKSKPSNKPLVLDKTNSLFLNNHRIIKLKKKYKDQLRNRQLDGQTLEQKLEDVQEKLHRMFQGDFTMWLKTLSFISDMKDMIENDSTLKYDISGHEYTFTVVQDKKFYSHWTDEKTQQTETRKKINQWLFNNVRLIEIPTEKDGQLTIDHEYIYKISRVNDLSSKRKLVKITINTKVLSDGLTNFIKIKKSDIEKASREFIAELKKDDLIKRYYIHQKISDSIWFFFFMLESIKHPEGNIENKETGYSRNIQNMKLDNYIESLGIKKIIEDHLHDRFNFSKDSDTVITATHTVMEAIHSFSSKIKWTPKKNKPKIKEKSGKPYVKITMPHSDKKKKSV